MGASESTGGKAAGDEESLESGLEQVSGWKILYIAAGSPCDQHGLVPYFDLVTHVNGVEQTSSDPSVLSMIKENSPLTLTIFSSSTRVSRELLVVPRRDWGGEGLLGLMIRFDSLELVELECFHVLQVYPGSPAATAGLQPYSDYILGTPRLAFKSWDQLDLWLTQADVSNTATTTATTTTATATTATTNGKAANTTDSTVHGSHLIMVFNSLTWRVREVVIFPNSRWGGVGSLGADVAQGYIHRLPVFEDQQRKPVKQDHGSRIKKGKRSMRGLQREEGQLMMNLLVEDNQGPSITTGATIGTTVGTTATDDEVVLLSIQVREPEEYAPTRATIAANLQTAEQHNHSHGPADPHHGHSHGHSHASSDQHSHAHSGQNNQSHSHSHGPSDHGHSHQPTVTQSQQSPIIHPAIPPRSASTAATSTALPATSQQQQKKPLNAQLPRSRDISPQLNAATATAPTAALPPLPPSTIAAQQPSHPRPQHDHPIEQTLPAASRPPLPFPQLAPQTTSKPTTATTTNQPQVKPPPQRPYQSQPQQQQQQQRPPYIHDFT